MEKLKVTFDKDSAFALVTLIENLVQAGADEDNDKLMLAGLSEIWENLKPKTVFVAAEYSIKLTAVQAIAMRIMHNKTKINGLHFDNVLLTLSNQVHQKYI